jgi:hypothetical protein
VRFGGFASTATLCVLFLHAVTLFGEPALTTIDDALYKADGSPFEGTVMINWRSFEGPATVNVPTNSLTAQIRGGRLFVRLVPTGTAPHPAYYSVRYIASGGVQFTELWSVPVSEIALRVRDVRIDWPPPTTAAVAPVTGVTVDDVEGLPEALDVRPEKGQSFAPNRAAVIGPTGEIEGAAGGPADCVRVDGTATPCGSSVVGGFTDNEAPAGAIDGNNRNFSLTGTPDPSASLFLHRNGLLQRQGLDYSVSANVVTFEMASTPQPGDILLASYRTDASLTSLLGFVDLETPAGVVDGANASFTLSASPSPAVSLMVYRNGMLLNTGADYTLSGNLLIFQSVVIPQPGDVLQVSYRTAGL